VIAAAVGLVTSAVTYGVLTAVQTDSTCACRGAPYLDAVDDTAARWVAAVRAGDLATAYGLLTSDAQQRHGTPEAFRGELPSLTARFAAAETSQWHRVYERTQGYDTPSLSVLVLVAGPATPEASPSAVSGLVVHSRATRDDPGRVDPDLGEALQLSAVDRRMVDVANGGGAGMRFVALLRVEGPPTGVESVGTGGGLYRLEPPHSVSMPTTPVLVIATVERPDGRFAIGAAPVQF